VGAIGQFPAGEPGANASSAVAQERDTSVASTHLRPAENTRSISDDTVTAQIVDEGMKTVKKTRLSPMVGSVMPIPRRALPIAAQ
jgi:hypothetical protein